MGDVGLEAGGGVQRGDQAGHRRGLQLRDPLAFPADQVHVLGLGGQVVPGCAVAQVRVADQADLLQQLQCPVDGREIDPGRAAPDLGVNVLRRRVLEAADCLQHQLALGGDPVAPGAQRIVPRLRHGGQCSARKGSCRMAAS